MNEIELMDKRLIVKEILNSIWIEKEEFEVSVDVTRLIS
jgi:hypothetical protein